MNEDFVVSFSAQFIGTRVMGRFLYPTHWDLRSEVIVAEGADELAVNITFAKLNYFFSEVVDQSLFYAKGDRWAEKSMRKADNNVVLVPVEPIDSQLALLFQAKLNALAEPGLMFGFVELVGDSAGGLSFVFGGDADDHLPAIDDWLPLPRIFETPWWHRDDGSTRDVPLRPNEDPAVIPEWAQSLDFIREQFRSAVPAKVIRPRFRPRVIEGSKRQ